MKERTRARGWALQILYAWETRGRPAGELIPVLHELEESLKISRRNRFYTEILVRLVAQNLTQIDRLLRDHLTNWSLSRLSAVDRNILRVGVAEMLYVDDVPPRVTIREMLRLAERYGTPDSPRFVNGVLDAVMKTIGGPPEQPGSR